MKSLLIFVIFHCFILGFTQNVKPADVYRKPNLGVLYNKQSAQYYRLAYKMLSTDYEKFKQYSSLLYKNSVKAKDRSYLAAYYYISAISNQRSGKFFTAVSDLKKGLECAKNNDTLKTLLWIETAHSFYLQHEVKDSVSHYLELAAEKAGQKKLVKQKRLLDFMQSILLSDDKADYEASISLLLSLLQDAEKRQNRNEIAFYSQHLGRIFGATKNEEASKRYFESALLLSDKIGNQFSKGETLCNMALLAINQKNYELAVSRLKQAMDCFEKVQSRIGICQVNSFLAQAYAAQGDLLSAQPYALKGFELLKEFEYSGNLSKALLNVKMLQQEADGKKTSDKEKISFIPKAIKTLDENRKLLSDKEYNGANEMITTSFSKIITEKNPRTFIHFKPVEVRSFEKIISPEIENRELQKLLAYKEQNYNIETQKNISELETRYRTAQKENKIKQLTIDKQEAELTAQRQKNLRNYSLLGVCITLAGSFAVYFIYAGKQKNKELIRKNTELRLQQEIGTLELSVLNKRLNPHFINNALTAMIPAFQRNAPDFYNSVVKLTRLIGSAFENESLTDSIAE